MNTLILRRIASTDNGTTGILIGEDKWPLCVTLELFAPIIPEGTYSVIPYFSPKNKHNCFLLLDIPGHTGIEIHVGNTIKDTNGCILVGKYFSFVEKTKMIKDSREIFNYLWEKYGTVGFKLIIKKD